MGVTELRYRCEMICPKIGNDGRDNTTVMSTLRSIVEANYGVTTQALGTMSTFVRTLDALGQVTNTVETILDVFIITTYAVNESILDNIENYTDTFSNACNASCIASVVQCTYAIGNI